MSDKKKEVKYHKSTVSEMKNKLDEEIFNKESSWKATEKISQRFENHALNNKKRTIIKTITNASNEVLCQKKRQHHC